MKLYNYCISQPNIPDVEMSFSDANVTAYVDGSSQRTKEITFKAVSYTHLAGKVANYADIKRVKENDPDTGEERKDTYG